MEKNKLQIRVATKEDAEALLAIYAPYVEKTAITFEYEVPSIEEFRCFRKEKESGKLCIKRWKNSFPGSIS